MSLCVRKTTIWVPTRSDTNRAIQSQKNALLYYKLEIADLRRRGTTYYLCNENKGADQYGTSNIAKFILQYMIWLRFEACDKGGE